MGIRKESTDLQKLRYILRRYRYVPAEIQSKQRKLQIRLTDPRTSAMKGFQSFVALENEIEFLEKYSAYMQMIIQREFSEREQKIIEGVMYNYDFEYMPASPIREVHEIWEKFKKLLTYDKIYNFNGVVEEAKEEYENK